jgi:acetoin utilization protein AcuB
MLVSDVMKTNVVSIPSNTSLAEARKIMDAHNIRRLPVIDRNVLVGVVTKDSLDKMGPSQLTTFSVNELVYLLNKITVKDVMHKDVITVHPDTSLEEAMALAQSRKIGSLIVVENDRVVGIVTSTAIITSILNPLLGIGLPGSRIVVINCFQGPDIEKVVSVINKLGVGITNLFITEFPEAQKHDLIIHLETDNPVPVSDAISKLGFRVITRKR